MFSSYIRIGTLNLFLFQFPGDKPINLDAPSPHSKVPNNIGRGHNQTLPHKVAAEDNQRNHHRLSPVREANDDGHAETDTKMIDLNMKPQRVHGQAANNQVQLLFLISSSIVSTVCLEIPKHGMVLNP